MENPMLCDSSLFSPRIEDASINHGEVVRISVKSELDSLYFHIVEWWCLPNNYTCCWSTNGKLFNCVNDLTSSFWVSYLVNGTPRYKMPLRLVSSFSTGFCSTTGFDSGSSHHPHQLAISLPPLQRALLCFYSVQVPERHWLVGLQYPTPYLPPVAIVSHYPNVLLELQGDDNFVWGSSLVVLLKY